jgi:hypothetical protein
LGTGRYEFKLKRSPKTGIPPDAEQTKAEKQPDVDRTKTQLGNMTTRTEAGKGSGKAVSQMVEPAFQCG